MSFEQKYVLAWRAFSYIASVPAALMLSVGFAKTSWTHLFVWGGMLALTWCCYIGVSRKSKTVFWLSLLLATAVWTLLFTQVLGRTAFVIEYGGWERADGYGSPAAFLLGLVGEHLFFIPLSFVVMYGWLSCTNNRPRSGHG